jgi:O-acetyl-ADP-ribose deacetylase (regulator of RNase III)
MIHYVAGDILKTRAQALAHGVSPNDDFKSGLASALRGEWPSLYSDFRHYYHGYRPKPGTLWTWGGVGGTRVVCLYTQQPAPDHTHAHPGKAQIEDVNHALRELARLVVQEGFTSVALPRVATGTGGRDWRDIKPLIEKHLGGLAVPVIVYEDYRPGVTAEEPGLAP